ncbi:RNA-guided endonuclease InsQ/TnpB family protein [Anaerosalibacter massiliensis]|uniref:Transposase n=1 Tax=Anaerosalibacter massiliensis TaxID=1347392 RepID=A0A9X2MJG1_9FIRM|nr:RNA-guided endonuclease TnpB family protein [Anaerosalibacter massiliensis]MCR2044633.1 transposase [Anaerosalibacter massiliensis]
MIRGIRVQLKPNNKQKTKLLQSAEVARFAYNWTLNKQIENYKNGGKFILNGKLRKEFTKLKQIEEYSWLNNYSNNITKQAIKDACNAYIRFFKGESNFPRFKSRRRTKPSFYVDTDKIQFTGTHVKLEKLATSKKKNKQQFNWIRLYEHRRIPYGEGVKYINPRVSFDGLNWWISVGIEYPDNIEISTNKGIGIDLGIEKLAVVSDGTVYKNINKNKRIKRLEKKKKRLQRKVSRKYEMNKNKIEGGEARYKKTKNIIKLENQLKKLSQRLTNIRHNYLHQITTKIIKRKPSFIVVEDLNVSGMMKNKHLSKAIQEQRFYEFYRQLQYKSEWNNIKFIVADRFFPSSKTCSQCGSYKKDLKLSDRKYICSYCGSILDRDYNASLNLKNYGQEIV